MDEQLEAPHPNGAVVVTEPPRRKRRVPLVAVVAVVLGLSAAWGYAIWYSVTRSSPENLDEASNVAVGDACATALAELGQLPPLAEDATAGEGIALVERENEVFDDMVASFATVEPDARQDAVDAYRSWVDDWRALITARVAFTEDLADDGSARLETPSIRDGSVRPITDRMNEYARQRDLGDCQPDKLQAEVVDAPRDYTLDI